MRFGSNSSGKKFSRHTWPKNVHRTRVVPSSFRYPVLKSSSPYRRRRFHSVSVVENPPSKLGVVRPMNTLGALAHAMDPPLPSSHRMLIAWPVRESNWALTTFFVNQEPTGYPTWCCRFVPADTDVTPGMRLRILLLFVARLRVTSRLTE